jgi:PAS domain S-box-containing protein
MTNKNLLRILFVEDLPSDAELAVLVLRKEGLRFEHIRVDARKEFIKALNEFRPDIIISDYMLPSYNGLQALTDTREFDPLIPFILYTGSMNEETAVECIKAGATDYVIKEHMTRLPFAVKEALEQHTILIEKRAAELLLKENEEKLQSIFSAAPVGIGLVVGRVFIEVNDTFCRMTGYNRTELLGKNAEAIYAKDEQNESAGIVIYRHIADKGTGSVETRFKCKDGRIINIFLSSTPLDKNDLTKGVTFIAMDITEKKKAEEALNVSRQLFQTLAQVSPVGIFRTNHDGYTTYLNPKYLELTGLSAEEALGFGWINALHPDDREILKDKWLSDIQSQKTSCAEYRFLKPDKSIVWVIWNAVPERYDNEITGYIGTITNITERKLAEVDLHIALTKYKTLFECFPLGITVSDEMGNILETNPTAEKLLSVSQDEQMQRNIDGPEWRIVRPDGMPMPPERYASVRALKQRCKVENVEMGIVKSKNMITWISVTATPIPLKGYGVVITYSDISDRKRFEERITHERRMLRTLIDNLPVMIYVKDIDCRKVIANKADVLNIGFKEEAEVLGKTDIELFPGQTGQRGYADDKKVIGSGKPIVNREEDFVDNKGVRSWLLTTKIALNDKDGKITGLVGIGHDITEQKVKEEELIRAKEQAEESDRLKSAFLANMSHEIRTPMNGIIGFTELLKEPLLTVEEQQDFIQTIQISGARMLNTINSIVDISKIESGLMSVNIKETNLNEKIEFVYKFFKPEVESKGLQFLFRTSLTANEAIINTDNEKVYGILTNLIRNAIKFTYEGSIEFGCNIAENKHAASLQFFVKDTGVGIPENQKELIFERFRQGSESHNRGYEGSGLGLSISKSYVEMLGGKIWMESEEGKGSIFYFTIPYNPVSEQTSAIGNVVLTETKEVQMKKLKILIVEDDEISHALITRTIQKISREVLHAITGVEAIEACRNNPDFDLVLMDIRMPRMNGLEATQQIRQFNKDVIIIAQTAYGFSGDSEKAIEAGCNDYIAKPINKTLLFEVIKKHCIK